MYIASQEGHPEVLKLLIKHGADVWKAGNEDATPVSAVSELGYLEVVELLIKLGDDINKADNDGAAPVFWALHYMATSRSSSC